MTILILCTWSILHLNVPVQVRPSNFQERMRRKLYLIGRKIAWGCFTLILPEFILGKAIVDRWSAVYSKRRMLEQRLKDGVEWGSSHAFLANMGGWYLKFDPDLAIPTREIAEGPTFIEQSRKQVEASEEPGRIKTAAKAATMPNPSFHSMELVESLQHANTDTKVLDKKPGLLATLSRVATFTALPLTNNPKGRRIAFPKSDLQRTTAVSGKVLGFFGKVLWKQNEHLMATVQEIQIPETQAIQFRNMWLKSLTTLQTDSWPLDAEQLYLCREMGLIHKLPDISEDEIEDRSKSDWLVEAIAITQLVWFCIQLIGRAVEHLAITQLEIFILAFATCSTLTYLLQLKKPKDVMNPTYISAVRYPTSEEMYTIASRGSVELGLVQQYPCIGANALHRCVDNMDQRNIFNVVSLASSSLFGALHLLAWNFHFPTTVELWFWRASSLFITGVPPLLPAIVNLLFLAFSPKPTHPKYPRVRAILVKYSIMALLLCGVLFTLCRVFLLVESLRTLAYLEPSAFVTTWSVNMPHIG